MKPILYTLLSITLCSCTTKVTQADEDSVKNIVVNFQKDFNEGSFKNAEAYTTTDWDHINPGGGIDIGQASTLKGVRAVHQSFLKDVSMTTDSMKVRFVNPEVALVTAFHTVDTYTTPDGVKHENERQIKSYVVVKQNGKWLLTLDHNTSIQQAPAID
jgi:uncharacterized protein (TIGR02246 family)